MGIGALLVICFVTLFAGMFLALMFSSAGIIDAAREEEGTRAVEPVQVSGFYDGPELELPEASEDRKVLYIEHYLRREAIKARRFAAKPSLEELFKDDARSIAN